MIHGLWYSVKIFLKFFDPQSQFNFAQKVDQNCIVVLLIETYKTIDILSFCKKSKFQFFLSRDAVAIFFLYHTTQRNGHSSLPEIWYWLWNERSCSAALFLACSLFHLTSELPEIFKHSGTKAIHKGQNSEYFGTKWDLETLKLRFWLGYG